MTPNVKTLTLGAVATFKSGGTPSKSRDDYWGGNLPWVSAKDLKSPIIIDSIDHLSIAGFAVANIAPANSLLILVRGMTLHKDVPVCLAGRDVAFNQDIKSLVVSEEISPKYLLFFLHSKKNRLLDLVDSAGHGTGRLNTDLLKAFPVLIPPLPEQTAIADLLSTWDVAIEKTEQLIAAKEKRFLWLFMKLFKEQSKNWQTVALSNICSIKKGQQLSKVDMIEDGKFYVLNGGIILSGYTDKWNTPKSTITISEGGNSCGFVFFNTEPFWCGGHCYSLADVSPDINNIFLYHYLKCHEKQIMRLRVGSGLPNIQRKDIEHILVSYPSISEQQQIAEILNIARQEIDLLKNLVDAYYKQKRGLMQKLLTGKWQLSIKEEIVA
ncbi:MAG: hypothetical protein BMS9Abin25_0575 [Gammaproteobacteria bacterium]|nr:MAG: hypothetical protein BMS9Abin25_0575 [Gammaproteobacteria bacterium]